MRSFATKAAASFGNKGRLSWGASFVLAARAREKADGRYAVGFSLRLPPPSWAVSTRKSRRWVEISGSFYLRQ
jgi:hypothetical protein